MKALSLNATKTETKTETKTKLLDRAVDCIEDHAHSVVEAATAGVARIEVFVTGMTAVMPELRAEAKAKAIARFNERYARFIK